MRCIQEPSSAHLILEMFFHQNLDNLLRTTFVLIFLNVCVCMLAHTYMFVRECACVCVHKHTQCDVCRALNFRTTDVHLYPNMFLSEILWYGTISPPKKCILYEVLVYVLKSNQYLCT